MQNAFGPDVRRDPRTSSSSTEGFRPADEPCQIRHAYGRTFPLAPRIESRNDIGHPVPARGTMLE
ncbi:hypothetical protein B1756_00365 [Natrarchaeobaculum aegyptiacum]|uniref:Uncharacterized protein n=1 Tax=Natrarchaeobaculum aegyptiacum TaxID=745377 RepID=A0A2Z2HY07_9EURY|nr:hypothetical protein B1756_00365 [Natrarchaeobaculum aegyptiacum]